MLSYLTTGIRYVADTSSEESLVSIDEDLSDRKLSRSSSGIGTASEVSIEARKLSVEEKEKSLARPFNEIGYIEKTMSLLSLKRTKKKKLSNINRSQKVKSEEILVEENDDTDLENYGENSGSGSDSEEQIIHKVSQFQACTYSRTGINDQKNEDVNDNNSENHFEYTNRNNTILAKTEKKNLEGHPSKLDSYDRKCKENDNSKIKKEPKRKDEQKYDFEKEKQRKKGNQMKRQPSFRERIVESFNNTLKRKGRKQMKKKEVLAVPTFVFVNKPCFSSQESLDLSQCQV